MSQDHEGPAQAADALAEIDRRQRQAVELSHPRPAWALLALMAYMVLIFSARDVGEGYATLFTVGALILLLVIMLPRLRRRAAPHPSLARQGWWIPALGVLAVVPVAIWLPDFVAGFGLRYSGVVSGLLLAGIGGAVVVVTGRLHRRYLVAHLAKR